MTATATPTRTASRSIRPDTGRGPRFVRRGLLYVVLVLILIIAVLPMVWALSGSFKGITEIFAIPPNLIPASPTLDNYVRLFTEIPLPQWLWTSLWVAVVSTTIAVVFSTMGGYAFAKFHFRGDQVLFDVMFSSMMIPITVLVIPLFVMVAKAGLGNTYVALILPWLAPRSGCS